MEKADTAAPAIAASATDRKTMRHFPLNALEDASGYLPPTSDDVAEIVMYGLLLEKLYEELDKLALTDRLILWLFSHGKSEREISQILKERSQTDSSIRGLPQKSVNLRKTSLFATLREKLKDYR